MKKKRGRDKREEADGSEVDGGDAGVRSIQSRLHENDFAPCTDLLSRLKVLLTKFPSLPPSFEETPNALQELTIAREIYEHAVVLSVKIEDQDAFERDFFQLKPYHTDTWSTQYLNLLRLLVQNRIAECHTELELLPPNVLKNPCIKHAVELEQSFMEGAYNHVLCARQTVPHDTYVYYMDLLAKTIRDEIAGCSEKAYDFSLFNDAKKMLMFSSDQELAVYISEEHPEWEIKDDCCLGQLMVVHVNRDEGSNLGHVRLFMSIAVTSTPRPPWPYRSSSMENLSRKDIGKGLQDPPSMLKLDQDGEK